MPSGSRCGFPLLTGGPLIALGALLMYLPGVDSLAALIAAQLAFVALGMAGAFAVMRRLGAGPWVALGVATAWGLTPTLVGLQGFGGTFIGYALLPAYLWVDLAVMDALAARRRLGLVIAAYALVRTGALFMDGYSFLASGLLGVALWAAWLLPRERPRLLGAGVLLGANLVAVLLYRLYVPVDYEIEQRRRCPGHEPRPRDAAHAQQLHLVRVQAGYRRRPREAVGRHHELAVQLRRLRGARAGGPGTPVRHRRSPLSSRAGAGRRGRPRTRARAGGQVRRVQPAGAAGYDMPAAAAPALPWGGALDDVPGLESVRATYRWFAVTRLAMILLAGLAIAELAAGPGRRSQLLALALAAVAAVEVLPTVPLFVRVYRAHYEDRVQ